MSTVLPDELLNISSRDLFVPQDIDTHETRFLQFWSLAQFWRISSVRNKFTQSPQTVRAENIFWRLWNDPLHRETIDETGIAHLCDLSQQPVRCVPFELSMSSRSRPQETCLKVHPERFSQFPDRCSADISLLKPVQNTGDKCASDQSAGNEQTHRPDSSANFVQNAATTSSRPKASRSASSRSISTRTSLSQRERPMPAATTGSKNKRPTLGRRKTSSTASQYTKPLKSPGLGGQQVREEGTKPVAQEYSAGGSIFELPSASSWEDESVNDSDHAIHSTKHKEIATGLDIDPDFRNKFSQKVASSSSLTLPTRMRKTGSIVRFAVDPAEGSPDHAENDDGSEARNTRSSRPPFFHRHSTSSVAVIDAEEEEDLSANLPRNRSHLSFLISERRATQGEESLGVESSSPHRIKAKSKKKRAEDEEILDMARRQGVTKAGGIRVPRQHRIDSEIESRYSSPDRDLTF